MKKLSLCLRLGGPALAAVALVLVLGGRRTGGPPPTVGPVTNRFSTPRLPKRTVGVRGPNRGAGRKLPGVFLMNRDYHRARSRVLMRRVVGPTTARLDFAAYDANMLFHDPTEYKPRPPEKAAALDSLHFGVLEGESLCDRLEETPLTQEEKSYPMSWLPMSEYLVKWDYDLASDLARAGAEVSAETWNDEEVYTAYQEVSRVYLHERDGASEMWARVEFKPWVSFLSGVDDEDGDGYPEIYGRFRPGVLKKALVERLVADYMGKALDREAMAAWVYELGSCWYPRYNTEALDLDEMERWPDEKTRADLGDELAALPKEPPTMVICARVTQTRFLYLVFYVDR